MRSSSTTQELLTYDDYCQIPEDGNRYEVIDGLLYMAPAPRFRHQRISGTLYLQLAIFVEKTGSGVVLYAPFDIVLSEHNVVQPDILFVSNDHASVFTEKNAQGAPDLVIEILSEGNRRHDEVVKRQLYERYGVQEYWIVDPELETVKIYRLIDQAYGAPVLLSREAGDALETPLLPGFRCALEEIFVP